MVPEVQVFAGRLDEIRRQAGDAIQDLDEQGLNFLPLENDASSLAVIIHHMAGVEQFWLRQIIGGVDIGRNRPDEFIATAMKVEELEHLMAEVSRATWDVLDKLVAEQLNETMDARGEPRSVVWCLLAAMDHLSSHLGHLQLTRQMYDKRVTGLQPERSHR